MSSTASLPLVDHLRSVTWHRHEKFEKVPFVIAMTNGNLPLESLRPGASDPVEGGTHG